MGLLFPIEILIGFLCILKILNELINALILYNKRNKEKQRLQKGLIITEHLHYLTPGEFEEWCKEFLIKLGYTDVCVTPMQSDGGKDIICMIGGKKVYVECKRYSASVNALFKVNSEIVKKLVGAMVHDGIDIGLIITTGVVDKSAYDCINKISYKCTINIIDGYELEHQYNNVFAVSAGI